MMTFFSAKGSRRIVVAVAIMLVGSVGLARVKDTIKTSRKTYTGEFTGFDGNIFSLRIDFRPPVEVKRSDVRSLTLEDACPVVVRMRDGSTRTVELKGYRSGTFTVSENGEDANLTAMRVSSIAVHRKPSAGVASHQVDDMPSAPPPLNTAAIEARGDLSPNEQAVLARYTKAHATHDSFLAESSAIVAEADKVQGGRRMEILEALRHRKVQEHPLLRELEESYAAMLSTFPSLSGGGPPPAAGGPRPAGGADELVLTLPPLAEGQVALIDTGFLAGQGSLSERQTRAIADYNAARATYERLLARPEAASADRLRGVIARVNEAQSLLLEAFPNLRIVQQ